MFTGMNTSVFTGSSYSPAHETTDVCVASRRLGVPVDRRRGRGCSSRENRMESLAGVGRDGGRRGTERRDWGCGLGVGGEAAGGPAEA